MTDGRNILCVGRLYCDVIFTDLPRMPTPGTEVFSRGVGLHAGGGATITAGHLAALGHKAFLAAFLPPAPFRDLIEHELRELQVDMRFCQEADPSIDPQLTVALVQSDERAFVTHRAGPAVPNLTRADLDVLNPSHIHIGEAATLIDNPDLITISKSLGASLSLDCSWDDDLNPGMISHLLPEIDVFLPNEAEIRLLREQGLDNPLARLTVVKMGRQGARAISTEAEVFSPAIPAKVVDTTGAGDAFNAAFLSAWLRDRSIEDCLAAGNAKGAEAVAFRGGMGGLST